MLSWVPQQRSYSIIKLPSDKASWSSLSVFSSQPFIPNGKWVAQKNYQGIVVKSVLAKIKNPPSPTPETLVKERHKYFDEVIITVRAGDGGHGAILSLPNQNSKLQGKFDKEKTKKKSFYKRDFDGSLILPVGGHGGDVIIYADESKDTLLEFHKKSRHSAKRGGNVDAMGVLSSQSHNGIAAPALRIPVPLGTVVKQKRGKLLADLAHPGDEVVVARGGQGGISLLEMPEHSRKKMMTLTTNIMRDDSDKVLVLGQPGEEVSLQLILRVVADVGLVGLPNAGKSTLLAAITLAKPDIADYPFTTLMPNLGRLDGDPSLGPAQFSSEATLADLPGLIEGAHLGKGLGRNFLRHLRRTRLLVHVVDAAAEDPVSDYRTVKEELRMYNPDYLERPYIVVLNKIDIPEAMERLPILTEEIWRIGSDKLDLQIGSTPETADFLSASGEDQTDSPPRERKVKEIEEYPRPLAVVGVSVLRYEQPCGVAGTLLDHQKFSQNHDELYQVQPGCHSQFVTSTCSYRPDNLDFNFGCSTATTLRLVTPKNLENGFSGPWSIAGARNQP
ncbi:putative GTP-binding protein OBGC2 [Sesamum angolense]|uniref:GTP-binding protein OBGC2 n=1 Tax=Sesamum angolense TaxID=2727404 RepID=A0AAE1WCC5_9LAMI|nr:putative GTP-binding protein OBGC2 [Sesamum angolense]